MQGHVAVGPSSGGNKEEMARSSKENDPYMANRWLRHDSGAQGAGKQREGLQSEAAEDSRELKGTDQAKPSPMDWRAS